MVAYTARKNPLAMPTGAPAPAPAFDVSADAYQPGAMSAAPMTASPMAPSAGSPFSPPQGPPRNALLASALDGFQRGFDPAGFEKREATNKAAEGDKLKQTLALMQQQRALPEAQRGQWWQQNAPTISKIIGQDVSQMPLDVTKFSDQALDGQIAALSAQAGIGPVVPEPMTAYQAAVLKQQEQQAGQPTPFNLGDGAFAEYDPTAEAGKRLNLIRQPTEAPVKMEQYTDGTGQVWDRNPYTGESRKANVPRARVPGEGGSEGNSFRLASPEEVAAAGLPPGTVMKINAKTNEPTILRNPSQTKEYDPVQIRQFKKSVSGLDLLNTTMDEYEATLKKSGGPQNIKGFWNVEQSNAIEAARNNTLVLAKELYELGALVGADFAIIEAAIKPATGIEASGQTNETIAASLAQVRSMLANKMSQIPEEFVAEVRNRYSGPMAKKFNATEPKATKLPPGVTQEMWNVMDEEDRAAFDQ